MTLPKALTHADVADAYARWAPIYDLAFTFVMRPGRRAAAAVINQLGGSVLDVGVGTGLELPMFTPNVKLTGIDLSAPMLDLAKARVAELGLTNIAGLHVMDAMNLTFADASFDAAVAPYVLTVVPDPERTLDEIVRVVRPGGEIVIVNHIGAERGIVAACEQWLGKRSEKLGWRPEFPWSIVADWLAKHPNVSLIERRTLAPFGLFTLIRLKIANA